MPPKTRTKTVKPASSLNTTYLLAYNFVSAALWAAVLAKVVRIATSEGVESGRVYKEVEEFARLTQTLAGLEVLHSLFGMSILSFAISMKALRQTRRKLREYANFCWHRGCASAYHDYLDAGRIPLPPRLGYRVQLPRYDEE